MRTKTLNDIEKAKEAECDHRFRIFGDVKVVGPDHLAFFCEKCLILVKKKKEYQELGKLT